MHKDKFARVTILSDSKNNKKTNKQVKIKQKEKKLPTEEKVRGKSDIKKKLNLKLIQNNNNKT